MLIRIWLFCWIVLISTAIVSASESSLDRMTFEGISYSINDTPLESFWSSAGHRPRYRELDTPETFGRDYSADWTVKENRLVLKNFVAISPRADRTQFSIKDIFPGKNEVVAEWYTGTILMIKGQFSSSGFDSIYPEVRCMLIEKGVIAGIRTLKKQAFTISARVGISLAKTDMGQVVVIGITENSPAAISGLLSMGSQVVFIRSDDWGEKAIDGLTIEEVNGYLQGIDGTDVTIGIQKPADGKRLEVTLKRKSHFR
jgi:hypothetical protein